MPLTCPFCGEKYFHDRKVCEKCEESLIHGGLITNEEARVEKWNCGKFLDGTTSAFGLHKPDNSQIVKSISYLPLKDMKFNKDYVNTHFMYE